MNIINRLAADKLRMLLSSSVENAVILVEGARQVGKTTLINSVLADFRDRQVISLNLETDAVLNAKIGATRDFKQFLRLLRDECGLKPRERQILFIDEAQESEQLGAYVRSLKEELPHTSSFLSGSSMTRLFREEQRIPVGRYQRFIVYPLTFSEFLSSRPRPALNELLSALRNDCTHSEQIDTLTHEAFLAEYDLYLQVGGLPRPVTALNSGADFANVRQQILLSQEDDFIRKSGIAERHLFTSGLRGVANFLGSPAKLTHIDEEYRVARKVVSQLQAWHLILQIEQRGNNSTSTFHPKRYLFDVGIAQHVRNMPFPQLSVLRTLNSALRTQLGGILENALLLNLLAEVGGINQVSGWRSSAKNPVEIDFVWREGSTVLPMECKAALKLSQRSFGSLQAFLEQADLRAGVLVSAAPLSRTAVGKRELINVPFYMAEPEVLRQLT